MGIEPEQQADSRLDLAARRAFKLKDTPLDVSFSYPPRRKGGPKISLQQSVISAIIITDQSVMYFRSSYVP